jgi:hypothetical protein
VNRHRELKDCSFLARKRTSEGRKAVFDIVRANKAAASALGNRRGNEFSIIFRVLDIVRPFNGRKGNRISDGLVGCFDQATEIERPHPRRARSLKRDHGALFINDRGNSEFQSLFKGYSGRRARLRGDSVTHFDIVGFGRKR